MEIFQSCVSQITLCLQIFAAPVIAAGYSKPKKHCVLYIIIFIAVFSVAGFGLEQLSVALDKSDLTMWIACIKFLIEFLGAVVCVRSAFECNIYGAIFCGVVGYCVQHIQARISDMLIDFLLPKLNFWATWAIYFAISIVFYILFFVLVRKTEKHFTLDKIYNRLSLIIAGLVAFVNIFYNTFGISYAYMVYMVYDEALGNSIRLFAYMVSLIFAAVAMMLAYSTFTNHALNNEKEKYARLLLALEEKYEAEKENIELINIKCHDLKHFLNNHENIPESFRQEIIDNIDIYDTNIKTGNEVLDILLAQKLLYCNANDIKLTCLINGRLLDFMNPSEVYALFGNALDNAVEYVESLPKEKRIVSLTELSPVGELLRYRIENWYEGDKAYPEAVKTKKDKRFHGFGLKSMKMAVEKYGGSLNVEITDNTFAVNISLLTPDK